VVSLTTKKNRLNIAAVPSTSFVRLRSSIVSAFSAHSRYHDPLDPLPSFHRVQRASRRHGLRFSVRQHHHADHPETLRSFACKTPECAHRSVCLAPGPSSLQLRRHLLSRRDFVFRKQSHLSASPTVLPTHWLAQTTRDAVLSARAVPVTATATFPAPPPILFAAMDAAPRH